MTSPRHKLQGDRVFVRKASLVKPIRSGSIGSFLASPFCDFQISILQCQEVHCFIRCLFNSSNIGERRQAGYGSRTLEYACVTTPGCAFPHFSSVARADARSECLKKCDVTLSGAYVYSLFNTVLVCTLLELTRQYSHVKL